jgi:hypothetical protein
MKVRTATVVLSLFIGCGGTTDDAAPSGGAGGGSGNGAGVSGAAGSTGGAGVSGAAGSTGGAGVSGAAGSTGAAANDASQTGGTSGTGGASGGGTAGTTALDGGTTDTGSGGDRDDGAADSGSGDICSLPPETGPCLALFPRFYFDPDTAQCREFTWGGCGGNANKFESREACQAACEHRADSCRPEGNCRACPVTSDANGGFCAFWGLECTFGPRCGGVVCICSSNTNPRYGEWRCTTPPC